MSASWLTKYGTHEEEIHESATGIVAFVGGGNASATQLTKKFNRVDTCTTALDSVKLTPALIGKRQYIYNNTLNNLYVFPTIGEFINKLSAPIVNTALVVIPGETICFECLESGSWITYGMGSDRIITKRFTMSSAEILTGFSSPKTIVKGMPSRYIIPISCQMQYIAGIPYYGGGNINIFTYGQSTPHFADVLTLNGPSYNKNLPLNAAGGDVASSLDLVLQIQVSNPHTGTGTIKGSMSYKVVNP